MTFNCYLLKALTFNIIIIRIFDIFWTGSHIWKGAIIKCHLLKNWHYKRLGKIFNTYCVKTFSIFDIRYKSKFSHCYTITIKSVFSNFEQSQIQWNFFSERLGKIFNIYCVKTFPYLILIIKAYFLLLYLLQLGRFPFKLKTELRYLIIGGYHDFMR